MLGLCFEMAFYFMKIDDILTYIENDLKAFSLFENVFKKLYTEYL